ncbi:sulfotransferase family protein [Maricaulis maris]|uniref:Sulfotransferase family protein n=1 Tax=Maricaulis maris TaxID=74318 RepID=A0A495D232_9PROT|nr:sulfotransferase [Maricaulis maris]RKQ95585.1 sulfotransferase family protein [Maricaulis maris]
MQYAVGKSPIFIGGAPRSGTTLLRAMVNASRNIVCGPEMRIIPALCHLAEQIETGQADMLERGYGLDRQALNDRFARTIDSLLAPLHARTGARVAEKTPANILHFSRLRQIFPDSPLIGIVRDGRDVVASLLSMDWTDGSTGQPMAITRDAEAAARLWCASIDAGRRMHGDPNYFELRYEALVSDPAGTISPLFDALGEDDAAKARALDHAREFDAAAGTAESSAGRVAGPVDRRAIGRWQQDLDTAQRDTVMRIAGQHLADLGYV